jgi:hypothetical protein
LTWFSSWSLKWSPRGFDRRSPDWPTFGTSYY